jgi:hypothetical protein
MDVLGYLILRIQILSDVTQIMNFLEKVYLNNLLIQQILSVHQQMNGFD